MAETPPALHPDIELRQHTARVRTSAVKIKAAASQILIDLPHGRLVRSAGRQLAAEVIALCEAQEAVAQAEKAAARTRTAA